jgi:DNA-directed RNA polymerase subunit E"
MAEKACRVCRYITSEGGKCAACGSEEITEKWSGYAYIEDVANSEIGKSVGAKVPGKYALNIK